MGTGLIVETAQGRLLTMRIVTSPPRNKNLAAGRRAIGERLLPAIVAFPDVVADDVEQLSHLDFGSLMSRASAVAKGLLAESPRARSHHVWRHKPP